jgi:AsmA protein
MNDSVSVMSPPAPPRKWLTHIAVAIVALLAVGAAAIGLAPSFLSADALDKDVAAQIRGSTGFSTAIDGTTHFRLFPQPRIDIENVAFSDPADAVRINTAAFSAYPRILPLLVGRIEVGRVALYQPDIRIAIDRKPIKPEGAIRRFAQSSTPQPTNALLLGRIDIVDGHVRIETQDTHALEFDAVDMSVDWPSAYASAALNGEFAVHGAPIGVQAWLAQPMELLHGGQSATILRLQSDVLTLSTSGRVSTGPRIQYVGQVSASAASLRKLAEIAGYSFPRHGTFADLDVHADVDWEGASAALSNLHMSLDGNDYEGSLAIESQGGLPRFSGTLASDFVDLTPFLAGVPEPDSSTALWNHQALDLSDLRFADLDLRISASRLRLYDMEVGDAALSLVTKPGLIDLALAEATSNHGTVEGRVSLAAKGRTLAFHVNGTGQNIDISRAVIGGRRPLSGVLDASLALDSGGADLPHLVQGLAGRAEISIADGRVNGADLAATLQAAGSKIPGEPIAFLPGTTAFNNLSFGLQLANGLAQIQQGKFGAPDVTLNFAGNADFAHRRLDLAALGEATQSLSRRTQSQPLSLRLEGSFDAPRLVHGEPDIHLPAPPPHSDDLPVNPATDPE